MKMRIIDNTEVCKSVSLQTIKRKGKGREMIRMDKKGITLPVEKIIIHNSGNNCFVTAIVDSYNLINSTYWFLQYIKPSGSARVYNEIQNEFLKIEKYADKNKWKTEIKPDKIECQYNAPGPSTVRTCFLSGPNIVKYIALILNLEPDYIESDPSGYFKYTIDPKKNEVIKAIHNNEEKVLETIPLSSRAAGLYRSLIKIHSYILQYA